MKRKNKRIGSLKKPDYCGLFAGRTRMLTKKANSEKLGGKSNENCDLNRRFALPERLSMNFNVHMGDLGLTSCLLFQGED